MYGAKSGLTSRLDPLLSWLAARRISPDAITLAAIPVSLLGAGTLLGSMAWPVALLAVPFLAAARLLLNLLDGALARRTGRSHPRGELFNEVGDRLADVAFLAPAAVLPGASPVIVLLGVLAAVGASYVGITAKAAGSTRIYEGVLAKPERMVLVSAAAVGAFVAGPIAWTIFGPVLLVGALMTLLQRIAVALGRLS